MTERNRLLYIFVGIAVAALVALGLFLPKIIESAVSAADNGSIEKHTIDDASFSEKKSDHISSLNTLSEMMATPENIQIIPIDSGYNYTEDDMYYAMNDTAFNLFDYLGTLYYDGYYDVEICKTLKPYFVIDNTDPTSNFILWYGSVDVYAADAKITLVIDDATGSLVGLTASSPDIDFGRSYFGSESAVFAFFSIKSDAWIDDFGNFPLEETAESSNGTYDGESNGSNVSDTGTDTYYVTASDGSNKARVPFSYSYSDSEFSCRFGAFPDIPDSGSKK